MNNRRVYIFGTQISKVLSLLFIYLGTLISKDHSVQLYTWAR